MTDWVTNDKELAEAKKNCAFWYDKVENLAADMKDLEKKMEEARMELAWWTKVIEEYNAAKDDEAVCDRCGEAFDENGSYETADGDYVCLDCHTSDIDGAEYMMEDR